MTADLDASYAAARAIMRRHAHTFYFAALWLRPERRRATFALYALFRTLDDLVDDASAGGIDREAARAELDRWRRWLSDPEAHPRSEPILLAVRDTLARHAIPIRHFLDLIDGLEMDLDGRRYDDLAALTLYCYRVASTVGLAMCGVLGATDPAALARAVELGVAMQLTNILRDVGEDYATGRMYLPRDMLAAAARDDQRVGEGVVDDSFRGVMQELIACARIYYARGERGLPYLSADARFAILLSARCYGGILRRIEGADYDVFTRRAHLSGPAKLALALRTSFRRRIGRGTELPPLPPGAPDGERLIELVSRPHTRESAGTR